MIGIGLLRLIFALTVVITHSHPVFGFTLGNSVIAVRAFFIISGFYMALVLERKYKSYKSFVVNRFLRIYPVYWVVMILSLCLGLFLIWWKGMSAGLLDHYILYFGNLSFISKFLLFVSQVIIFGRNIIMYSGLNPVSGSFVWNAKMAYEIPSFPFLIAAQAWALGLILCFYLVAPFLVKIKLRMLLLFGLLLIIIRVGCRGLGMVGYYYDYMMFPFELIFFVMGILSYHLYARIKDGRFSKKIGTIGFWVIVIYVMSFQYVRISFAILEIGFYLTLSLLIPFIFTMSKNSLLDRSIGEYAYPVYISHGLVGTVLSGLFFFKHPEYNNYMAIAYFVPTMIFSFLLLKFVQFPIDKIRKAKIK